MGSLGSVCDDEGTTRREGEQTKMEEGHDEIRRSPAHYWRLADETEEQRLERLIKCVTPWASEGGVESTNRFFWQSEKRRLEKQLRQLHKG